MSSLRHVNVFPPRSSTTSHIQPVHNELVRFCSPSDVIISPGKVSKIYLFSALQHKILKYKTM